MRLCRTAASVAHADRIRIALRDGKRNLATVGARWLAAWATKQARRSPVSAFHYPGPGHSNLRAHQDPRRQNRRCQDPLSKKEIESEGKREKNCLYRPSWVSLRATPVG